MGSTPFSTVGTTWFDAISVYKINQPSYGQPLDCSQYYTTDGALAIATCFQELYAKNTVSGIANAANIPPGAWSVNPYTAAHELFFPSEFIGTHAVYRDTRFQSQSPFRGLVHAGSSAAWRWAVGTTIIESHGLSADLHDWNHYRGHSRREQEVITEPARTWVIDDWLRFLRFEWWHAIQPIGIISP